MHVHNAGILALRSLLNCVAREYPERVGWSETPGHLRFTLTFPGGGGSLFLPALYRSETGHHLFGEPVMLSSGDTQKAISPADAVTRYQPAGVALNASLRAVKGGRQAAGWVRRSCHST